MPPFLHTDQADPLASPFFVGVTGGQGVGKSTFCSKLEAALINTISGKRVRVMGGLGDDLKAQGIPLGSAATADAVAAVYSAHLRRELNACPGLHILDRCSVDALAYAQTLNVNSDISTKMYALISATMARQLKLVIHLEMTGRFVATTATHETSELRQAVARRIPLILRELDLNYISLNAADDDGVKNAVAAILNLIGSSRYQLLHS